MYVYMYMYMYIESILYMWKVNTTQSKAKPKADISEKNAKLL